MKKTQKKLGNKGFSLVELIVVIAIMAVLVGVLAPTLIKNIEKSRESKDAQNIEQIKSSIEVALQDETAYDQAVPTGSAASSNTLVTLTSSAASVNSLYSSFKTEFDGIMSVANTKLTSKKYKNATVTFTVNEKGQVNVTESGVN
jgi:type IV pilus assembly protein PilA